MLAYNLIRTIMAQAADRSAIEPRSISFKTTLQVLEAFQPVIANLDRRPSALRTQLYDDLLAAIAIHRVGNRPDRIEPRRRKRLQKRYDFLRVPRPQARLQLLKGVTT